MCDDGVLAVRRLHRVEDAAHAPAEARQILGPMHDVVMRRGRGQFPETGVTAPSTEAMRSSVMVALSASFRATCLPGRRLARWMYSMGVRSVRQRQSCLRRSWVDIDRGNVGEEPPELDEQRLWCQGEEGEVAEVADVEAIADLTIELPAEIGDLELPIFDLVIAVIDAVHVEGDRLALGGIARRQHRRLGTIEVDRVIVLADPGAVKDDMARPIFIDLGDRLNPRLVPALHVEEDRRGVAADGLPVDQPVVRVAHQHEVGNVVGEERRAKRIAARPVGLSPTMCAT